MATGTGTPPTIPVKQSTADWTGAPPEKVEVDLGEAQKKAEALEKAAAAVKNNLSGMKVPGEMSKDFDTLSGALDKFMGKGAGDAKKILSEVGGFAKTLLSSVEDNAKNLAGAAVVMLSDSARKMANPLEGMGFLSEDKALVGLNLAMKAILDTQQTARVGFIRLGQSIESSEAAAANYPNTLRRTAAAYGMQGKEIDGMMKSLQGVPIIQNQVVQMTQNSVGAQEAMVDTVGNLAKVSLTFGMSSAESAMLASMSYRQFNQTAQDTINTMSTMSSAAKETGVDRRIANEQIMEASRGLAIFGQKSDSAAGTWLTFMKALKDTTPIDQVGSITEQVTKSIASMSVQNRAFLGMMSGMAQGRSALGGAIQMEMMMRSPEGMQKHLESLTTTLAQFAGGQIITLEEAAQNPQLEVSFQMQREMIGKLMGITDAQVQNRILETLKNVQSGGMSQVDGSKEIANLQKEGGSIQDKQLTAIEKLDQHLAIWFQDAFNIDTSLDRLNSFVVGDTGKEDENWLKRFNLNLSAQQTHASKETNEKFIATGLTGSGPRVRTDQNILNQGQVQKEMFTAMDKQGARPGALTEQLNAIKFGTLQFNKEVVDLGTGFKTLAQAVKDARAAIGGTLKVQGDEKIAEKAKVAKIGEASVVVKAAEEEKIKTKETVKSVSGVTTTPPVVAGAVASVMPSAPTSEAAAATPGVTSVQAPEVPAATPVAGAVVNPSPTSDAETLAYLFPPTLARAPASTPISLEQEKAKSWVDDWVSKPEERPTLAEQQSGSDMVAKPTAAKSTNNKNELFVKVDVTSDLSGIKPYIDKGVKEGVEEWAKNYKGGGLNGHKY